MKRGFDFEKAEAAFKRAAYKATHGTREERSGRFLSAENPRSFWRMTADRSDQVKTGTKAHQRGAGKGSVYFVMPGLVPGIHVFMLARDLKTWMAGTSPAMTDSKPCE